MVLRPRTGSKSCRLSLCGRNFKTRAMCEYDDRVRQLLHPAHRGIDPGNRSDWSELIVCRPAALMVDIDHSGRRTTRGVKDLSEADPSHCDKNEPGAQAGVAGNSWPPAGTYYGTEFLPKFPLLAPLCFNRKSTSGKHTIPFCRLPG